MSPETMTTPVSTPCKHCSEVESRCRNLETETTALKNKNRELEGRVEQLLKILNAKDLESSRTHETIERLTQKNTTLESENEALENQFYQLYQDIQGEVTRLEAVTKGFDPPFQPPSLSITQTTEGYP